MFERKPPQGETPEHIAMRLMSRLRFGTLATVSPKGLPQVATIEFCATGQKDFSFFFNTYTRYRKYANLKKNGKVAFVVTDKQPQSWNSYSLQLEGKAVELKTKAAIAQAQKIVTARFGSSSYYLHSDTRFFKVTPNWARLLDYEGEEPRHRVLKRR